MHPVRTTKNAITPRSVKQLSRAAYTVRNPLGAAENALIGSVLNAGGGRRRSTGSRDRSGSARQPASSREVFVGTGVRAGEALESVDRIASLMAVQRDRFGPVVMPQVPDPIPPDQLAMQKALWNGLGPARPSFWKRKERRQVRERLAEQAADDAHEHHQAALAAAANDRARADEWWTELHAGDPATVTAALTAAFADNVAPTVVLDAGRSKARILLLLPEVDVLGPKQAHVTPSGRLSSRNWPKADLHDAYAALLGAHVLATARETWAVAPSVDRAQVIGVRPASPQSKPAVVAGGLEVLFDVLLDRSDPRWNDDDYSYDVFTDQAHGLRRTGKTFAVSAWPTADLPPKTVTAARRGRAGGPASPGAPNEAGLRLTRSTGPEQRNPTEGALLILIRDMTLDDWFTLGRADDDSYYIQAARLKEGYLIERRAGTPDSHEHAITTDLRLAQDVVTTWAFGATSAPSGQTITWTPGFA